ncbi:lipid A deacylase LpxR family protein [Roseomonas sp. BN140053]|uniref:lipid A deacylase LpxR family protein n=1 Tax=Roseomonas sp. BN140053 TaxID=3391898 RepID=UPI0039ED88C9
MRRTLLASVLLPFLLSPAGAATPPDRAAVPPPDPQGTLSLTVENDFFGGGTDRYYSNGLLLTWRSPSAELPAPFAWMDRNLDWLLGPGELRWGLSLGHNIYTPEDKQRRPSDPNDRPYAGHLYGAFTLTRETLGTQTLFELQAGIVGPGALGEQVQNNYHHLIGVRPAAGWDSQLKDEPVVDLLAERRWRLPLAQVNAISLEAIPSVTGSVGNGATYAAAGGMLRIGDGLDADWGPVRIRPALAGSGFLRPRSDLGWYLFAGVEGRVVARDIFLDGNTFRDSRSVDRRWVVGDLQLGAAVLWRGVRLAYTQVLRTEEFYGQRGRQSFGSVSLSARF